MRVLRAGRYVAGLVCLAGVGVCVGPAWAEDGKGGIASEVLDGVPFCTVPLMDRSAATRDVRVAEILNETEPNDSIIQSNTIPLSMSNPDVDMLGNNSNNEDDYFSVELNKGDILGVAVLQDGSVPRLDPMVTIYRPNQSVFLRNDDGAGELYPIANPLPQHVVRTDADASIIAPETGTYYLRVHPWVSGTGAFSEGNYILQTRLRRSVFDTMTPGSKQQIWLDFSGPVVPAAFFWGGNANADLTPLNAFLDDWGLSASDLDALVNAIVGVMQEDFDALTVENPTFDYIIRNSHQHTLLFGTPNVTTIFIGGTIEELGIFTIGLAESIDPGNFETREFGIVLLDLLSGSAGTIDSVNSLTLDPSASKIDAVAKVVGTIASHEVGHMLGNWHTDNANGTLNVMDQGGVSVGVWAGVGADAIFGTSDDLEHTFATDIYADELVGAWPISVEHSAVRTAYALSGAKLPSCSADLNGDNIVSGEDLLLLLGNWGGAGAEDLNNDGTVDGTDLLLLIGIWGSC